MYWNGYDTEETKVETAIKSNMRCIETEKLWNNKQVQEAIKSNMRCIETQTPVLLRRI